MEEIVTQAASAEKYSVYIEIVGYIVPLLTMVLTFLVFGYFELKQRLAVMTEGNDHVKSEREKIMNKLELLVTKVTELDAEIKVLVATKQR